MKKLRFVVLGKNYTSFDSTNITFLRNVQSTKSLSIPYNNGNGYIVADGAVLYTQGTSGQEGHFKVIASGTQTINGTGSLNVLITHYPSATQANQSKSFVIDGSTVLINILYNSKPVNNDLDIEVNNREHKVITMAMFDGYWSDYDSDGLSAITIYNSNTNLQYNGSTYTPGTPIPVVDIQAGKLKYIGNDTDAAYNDNFSYTVTDTHGNVSD